MAYIEERVKGMGAMRLDDIDLPSRWGKQPVSIGTVLKRTLSAIPQARERYYEFLIVRLWKEKMNAAVRDHTLSVTLRKNKLYVEIDSPALRDALTKRRVEICRQLNDRLGSPVVRELIFR